MAHHMEVTAGGFWKTLPGTVTYEATIPLIYETSWQEHEVRGGSPFKGACNQSNRDSAPCIILNSLNQLKENFRTELDILARSWSTAYLGNCSVPNRQRRALDFLGEGLSWCCGVATQHKLDLLTTDEQSLRSQMSKLSGGLSKIFSKIAEDSKKFEEHENLISDTFKATEERIRKLESFTGQVFRKAEDYLQEEKNFQISILTNQFENLKHIIDITRALKRQGVVNSCRQHQIPISVVDPAVLKHDLEVLEGELGKLGQNLAVPLQDLSKLYQIAICDCSFSRDRLVINIRIPITQRQRAWELLELVTTPFAWYNQTCLIQHQPLFLAISRSPLNSKSQLRQISGSGLRHCQPFRDRLCFLPRFSADSMQGPACAKKLYNGASVEELSHHCPMSCHKSITTTISEISEETYIIAHPKKPTLLSCENSTEPLHESSYSMPGSVKLYVPCHCELSMGGEVVIPKRFPCAGTLPLESTITHIIPAAWSTLKSFVLKPHNQDNLPRFLKPEDCLNQNWTLNVPHLNLTSTKDNIREILDNVESVTKNSYADTYGQHGDAIFFVWNSILSIAVCYLIFGNRHNLGFLPAFVTPARGETWGKIEHDLFFAFLILGLVIFVVYLLIKILLLIKKSRDKSKLVTGPKPTNGEIPPLNGPLPSRRQFILQMDNVDLNSLSPGKSLDCVIQGIQEESVESAV